MLDRGYEQGAGENAYEGEIGGRDVTVLARFGEDGGLGMVWVRWDGWRGVLARYRGLYDQLVEAYGEPNDGTKPPEPAEQAEP